MVRQPARSGLWVAAAAAAHEAWLARAGLAARSQRTYREQVARYLAWLQDALPVAGSPAGAGWYQLGPGGQLTAPEIPPAGAQARQAAADGAVARYLGLLSDGGAGPAGVKLAAAAIGGLHEAIALSRPTLPGRVNSRPYPRPAVLSAADSQQLLAGAAARGSRDRALVEVCDDVGLRACELRALDVGDVTSGGAELTVQPGWFVHRSRTVPLRDSTAEAVAAWLGARPAGGRALFVTRNGQRLAARTVEHIVRQAGRDAGLSTAATVTLLRNTRTARLLDAGTDPSLVAWRLGHSRTETLRPYLDHRGDDVDAPGGRPQAPGAT
jgi:integrase/recombinase XerC